MGNEIETGPTDQRLECAGLRNWAEIDCGALRHNFRVAAGGGWGVIAIIKADGYGHGAVEIARAIENEKGLEGFGVATLQEGLELRENGISAPILILGTAIESERKELVEQGFWASISSVAEAKAYDDTAAKLSRRALVHLCVDTGMGRMGVPEVQFNEAVTSELACLSHLDLVGLASHFPSADEDTDFTLGQISRFQNVIKSAWSGGIDPRLIHLANSAGLLGFGPDLKKTNSVRPGLMLYGISPLPEHQSKLRPALSLKSRVLLLRDLPDGHGISYGRTCLTKGTTRVATLGIGYGDGLLRHLSGNGYSALISGKRCPLLGRVTMDQIMVDVSALGDTVDCGDEAVLIGHQGRETILATEMAEKANTIAWEVFTSLTKRVKRVYLNQSENP